MKYRIVFLWVSSLVVIDQIIKVVIYHNYYHLQGQIVGNFLVFRPIQNTEYSYLNAVFRIGIGRMGHIIPIIIVLPIVLLAYDYIRLHHVPKKYIHFMFIFLIAGTSCSLVDKIFWNGSIDYLRIMDLFTFDLKDCYITSGFEILAIPTLIKHYKAIKTFKTRDLLKHGMHRLKSK